MYKVYRKCTCSRHQPSLKQGQLSDVNRHAVFFLSFFLSICPPVTLWKVKNENTALSFGFTSRGRKTEPPVSNCAREPPAGSPYRRRAIQIPVTSKLSCTSTTTNLSSSPSCCRQCTGGHYISTHLDLLIFFISPVCDFFSL